MSSGFMLIMMLHLVIEGDSRPENLNLKEVQIVCDSITSTLSREGYRYVGISTKNSTDYISDYTDIDKLNSEINKQCRRKGK